MSVSGTWTLSISTPIGSLPVVLDVEEHDGTYSGVARGKDEEVPMRDIAVRPADGGTRMTWAQSIRRRLRLNLEFDVTVTGDALQGFSRAGRLPRSSARGTRTVPPAS